MMIEQDDDTTTNRVYLLVANTFYPLPQLSKSTWW